MEKNPIQEHQGQHAVSSQMAGHPQPPYQPDAQFHHSSSATLTEITDAYRQEVAQPQIEEAAKSAEITEYAIFPWQVGGVNPDVADNLCEGYQQLLSAESQPPAPDEIIHLPRRLAADSAEAAILETAGHSTDRIEQNNFSRQELIEAGFFFINRLGGGEKGIIEAVIPDPESPTGQIDLTNRALLTRAELEKVYRYQTQNGDGLQGIPPDEIRSDALTFLVAAQAPSLFPDSRALTTACLPETPDSPSWVTGSAEEHKLVDDFLQSYTEHYMQLAKVDKARATEITRSDLFIKDILMRGATLPASRVINFGGMTAAGHKNVARGGVSVYSLFERSSKISGLPSPFLESGYHFSNNIDVMLEVPDDTAKLQRFNIVNVHLMAGHPDFIGLSEMGKADWDQQYLSTRDFVNKFSAYAVGDKPEDSWREDLLMIDSQGTRQQIIAKAQENMIAHCLAQRSKT